jgi:hypothetical protein
MSPPPPSNAGEALHAIISTLRMHAPTSLQAREAVLALRALASERAGAARAVLTVGGGDDDDEGGGDDGSVGHCDSDPPPLPALLSAVASADLFVQQQQQQQQQQQNDDDDERDSAAELASSGAADALEALAFALAAWGPAGPARLLRTALAGDDAPLLALLRARLDACRRAPRAAAAAAALVSHLAAGDGAARSARARLVKAGLVDALVGALRGLAAAAGVGGTAASSLRRLDAQECAAVAASAGALCTLLADCVAMRAVWAKPAIVAAATTARGQSGALSPRRGAAAEDEEQQQQQPTAARAAGISLRRFLDVGGLEGALAALEALEAREERGGGALEGVVAGGADAAAAAAAATARLRVLVALASVVGGGGA